MDSLCLPAYAKINLGLSIKSKRADGFHEIETILQQIDLKDEIAIKLIERPEITFHCDAPGVPNDEANLCVRAATLLQQRQSVSLGADIILNKSIPVGAGLGGGSSNAAVTLLGLNKLWQLQLSTEELQHLASQLGSDVPFFIHGGAAIARGKGEQLEWFEPMFDFPILLVYPELAISTKWAYSQVNLDLTMTKKSIKLLQFKDNKYNRVELFEGLENQFEQFVFKKYPILRIIKEDLSQSGAIFSSLSGSGSVLFGVFKNENQLLEARKLFQNDFTVFVAKPIKWGHRQVKVSEFGS